MEEEVKVTEISYKKLSNPSESVSKKKVQKKITNFISLEPNKSPHASIQPKIDGFLVRKPKALFIPVDLNHPSSINKKR